jgi:cytochrome c-type biogenesis protein
MLMFDPDWVVAFFAGLLTPLGAVCVLPLYPGYLSFLAGPGARVRRRLDRVLLGFITITGIIASMFLFGLVVVFLFSYPLAGALWILSPVAYILLGILGLLLIFDLFPQLPVPAFHGIESRAPFIGALLFGLFFGILILPCNAAPIAILLALSTSAADLIVTMFNFIFFGAGMALPFLAISFLSVYQGKKWTSFLARNKRAINLVTGSLMLVVALYYLFFVFRILDL